jgi:hypothetical protein
MADSALSTPAVAQASDGVSIAVPCWNCILSPDDSQYHCVATDPPGNPGFVSCTDGVLHNFCTVGDWCTPTLATTNQITADGRFRPDHIPPELQTWQDTFGDGAARSDSVREAQGSTFSLRACNGMIVYRRLSAEDGARVRAVTDRVLLR